MSISFFFSTCDRTSYALSHIRAWSGSLSPNYDWIQVWDNLFAKMHFTNLMYWWIFELLTATLNPRSLLVVFYFSLSLSALIVSSLLGAYCFQGLRSVSSGSSSIVGVHPEIWVRDHSVDGKLRISQWKLRCAALTCSKYQSWRGWLGKTSQLFKGIRWPCTLTTNYSWYLNGTSEGIQ